MSLATRLLLANPGAQVTTALSGALTTPGAKGTFIPPTSYESIGTVTGDGTSSSLTISSIPQTFTHLQVRWVARNNRSATLVDTLQMYFNSDNPTGGATNNYARHAIRHTKGGTTIGYQVDSGTSEVVALGLIPAVSNSTSIIGSGIAEIQDYTNANKFKSVFTTGGYDTNSTFSYVEAQICTWASSAAITSITFINNGSAAFSSTTKFALYGIKG